jgi:ABC-2 type transport system ATP-binding protein
MDDAPLIAARGLVKSFGALRALDGLDVSLARGTTGLLGPNGAGKSTFLKVVLGLLRPDSGTAHVLGEDAGLRGAAIRRRVGYMPEKDCHFPGLSAVDVVAQCGELSGLPPKEAFRRAHEVLHYVGLSEQRFRAVDGFSAGTRQRVKLAAALVHDPDLLILDEPTNGLDPAGRRDFLRLVAETAAAGISVVLSTHLLPDVEAVCERAVVVARGRVLRQGTVAELTRGIARSRVVSFTGDPGRFLERLAARGVEAAVDPASGALRVQLPEGAGNGAIISAAAEASVGLKRLSPAHASLEDVFLEAVGDRRAGA